ncbi:pentapeptide repeat-containing protein [Rickettsiella endosymbiont of Aleochara curtula]|uniref:pentapeptide repeat-containing protein n=1 Tax=Rickettsiella endosymbiont of Aleochara curtula TaxID=3077936 RepID=UPI00313DE20A
MPKDSLLTANFYSLHLISDSEASFNKHNLEELDQSIKQQIYPHLIEQQVPIYYAGRHTLNDLNRFVYKRAGSELYTDNFIILQNELSLTLIKIKNWARTYNLEHAESLTNFMRKLEQPSDGMVLLYGDGKKLLERITVLLHNSIIPLQERKNILINLLADNELAHCIAGCYARINSAALQLEANLEGNQQIKLWLRSFAKDTASNVAAKRPFAIPDSYQVLVCKASHSAITANLLHAHNYLLSQAKESGFPILIERDLGAIELGNKLSQFTRSAIVNAYIKELEQQVTAKNLVDYFTAKLHESFNTIMHSDNDYTDKVAIIMNKLNLIGEDSWFKENKVGLEEIFDANNELKPKDNLKITVTQRLLSRKIFTGFESKKITLSNLHQLEYYGFPEIIDLTWVWVNQERKFLLQLIKEDRLASLIPTVNRIKQDLFSHYEPNFIPTVIILIHTIFVTNTKSLLTILKHLPTSYHVYFLDNIFSEKLAVLIRENGSVHLFMQLLHDMPNKANRVLLIQNCGKEFIHKLIDEGLSEADIRCTFPGLSINYKLENYDTISKNQALSVTKVFLNRLIDNNFINFSELNFKQLPFHYLDWNNFASLNFKKTKFYQSIQHANFDNAQLEDTIFYSYLIDVSFRHVDLRKTNFRSPNNSPYKELDFTGALLSTNVFRKFLFSDMYQFTGANLKEIDFQRADIKDRLSFLDFSGANLEGCNLNQLNVVGLKLVKANLINVDLRKTKMHLLTINSETKLQGSQLEVSLVKYMYNLGFKNFDECKVYINMDFLDEGYEPLNFYRTDFKNAKFFGLSFYVHFIESDLTGSIFHSSDPMNSKFYLSLKAIKTKLDKVHFEQVNFLSDTRFKFYTLKDVSFNQVEMTANILFEFYESGHRDFSGVKAIKGPIPRKLAAYPVWNAKLPKNVFIDLFKLGLRNFRGSDLNSFYLSQVLTEKAMSAIDLKLEYAQYKPSPLGCSFKRSKRQTNQLCSVHLLLQKIQRKHQNMITLEDVELLARSSAQNFIIKDTPIFQKPLYYLQNVNEANFYWGYETDVSELYRMSIYAINSISEIDRSLIKLHFYITKSITTNENLLTEVQYLKKIGFCNVVFHYFNQQRDYSSIYLENRIISVGTGKNILFKTKFSQSLIIIKNPRFNEKISKNLLRHIARKVKEKIGQGRMIGKTHGARYDLAAMVLFFIGEALSKPETAQIKSIDELTKIQLKEMVPVLVENIGHSRGANANQIQSAINIANRCIDQAACSTEELLITDIMDSMYRMRPDLEIGNDYARKKIVEFFVNIGDFLKKNFSELKLLLAKFSDFKETPRTLTVLDSRGSLVNGSLPFPFNWYEQPLLLELIKRIESTFIELGYDLEQDNEFSEINLIETLNIICNNLTHYKQGNRLSSNEITLFLQDYGYLQEVIPLIQPLNSSDLSIENSDEYMNDRVPENVNLYFNSSQISNESHVYRKKRALNFIEQEISLRNDQAWQIADQFLAKHEQSAKFNKTKRSFYENKLTLPKQEVTTKTKPSYQPDSLKAKTKNIKKILPDLKNPDKFFPLSEKLTKNTHSSRNIPIKLIKNAPLTSNNHLLLSQFGKNLEMKSYNKKNHIYKDRLNTNTLKLTDVNFGSTVKNKPIKFVTAHCDINSSLFFINFCIKCCAKQNYVPLNKKQFSSQQKIQRKTDKFQKNLYR